MGDTFRVRRLNTEATVVRENGSSGFESGIPESVRDKADALTALINRREFKEGDGVGITAEFGGVFTTVPVKFVSFDSKRQVLSVKKRSGATAKIQLRNLQFNIVNISLFSPREYKETFEDYMGSALRAVREEYEQDPKRKKEFEKFLAAYRLRKLPLTPTEFILGGVIASHANHRLLAYERGTPMHFTLSKLSADGMEEGEQIVTGELVKIHAGGIDINGADSSLGEVIDAERGTVRIPWMMRREGKIYAITTDTTLPAQGDISMIASWNRVPQSDKRMLADLDRFRATYS